MSVTISAVPVLFISSLVIPAIVAGGAMSSSNYENTYEDYKLLNELSSGHIETNRFNKQDSE